MGRPRLNRKRPALTTTEVNPEKTREGQNGAGPFINESTEGEGRLWRKKSTDNTE